MRAFKCPVCQGSGLVPANFDGGGLSLKTPYPSTPEECLACNGHGVVFPGGGVLQPKGIPMIQRMNVETTLIMQDEKDNDCPHCFCDRHEAPTRCCKCGALKWSQKVEFAA